MLYSLLVLLFISPALTYLCSCVNRPELVLLTGSTRRGQTFCLGERAQLKCNFPEGKQALQWYVNSSKRPIDANFLAEDLPGHNTTTPFGNFTIVSIFKEESFRGNYSCAVHIPYPGRDVRSNSVEVLFEGIIYNYVIIDYTCMYIHSIHLFLQNYNLCTLHSSQTQSQMVSKQLACLLAEIPSLWL